MKQFSSFKRHYKNIRFLYRAGTPLWIILAYLSTNRTIGKQGSLPKFVKQKKLFLSEKENLTLNNDWFSNNITIWLAVFDALDIQSNTQLKALEIGSWQGLSAYFILHHFRNAELTCVDTWLGADEHQAGKFSTKEVLNNIETCFDKNLAPFNGRFNKYKGTSLSYFTDADTSVEYELIYVDGSHYCDDVLIDALKSFSHLKSKGLLIFDDYLWHYYKEEKDNPIGAINTFLSLKRGQYDLISVGYQLILQKR